MNRLPGFVAYYLLDAGDGIIASVSVCDSREGAKAAATLAAEWFRSDWPSFQLIPPEVTDGEVLVHGEVSPATGRRHSQRRNEGERRVGGERRAAVGSVPAPAVERRTVERRGSQDRRAAAERRTQKAPAPRLGVAPAWRKPSRIS
jgi:hypothetical protein